MKVALFIPCYVDQFYPQVAIATMQLLQKFGCEVTYPLDQTCCGQPMANAGYEHLTGSCNKNFINNFKDADYIVGPTGSCVTHIKDHLHDDAQEAAATHIRKHVYELTEFMVDVLKVEHIDAYFPHRVGMHQSCHGLRMLHLGSMSEKVTPHFSKAEQLLQHVKGLELSYPTRTDECCGFGGTFCVTEEAVSVRMGKDRIEDHSVNDVEYITGGDMSCLMHLEGILKKQRSHVKVIHLAEILNANVADKLPGKEAGKQQEVVNA
ncbi:(Fe-S)-binding protein [Aridibaculum aurantiacum]|uniref:(Fe-S)-binding protein n=1 Tax=Aridibaculum aurantiacum TaxID=2810307 RepID=UPI001A95CFAC|nr:(Fe-S)-binding protein [Aridibaculum aurantiacum]